MAQSNNKNIIKNKVHTDEENMELLYANSIRDIFYLAKCAINNVSPDLSRVKVMNGDFIFNISTFHSVEALVFYALRLCDLGITVKDKATGTDIDIMSEAFGFSRELLSRWSNAYKGATLKNVQLDTGRTELFEALDKMGCWYLPLKGAILKNMYPAAGMRQMSDNDILFDESFRQQVKAWFEEHGYTTQHYNTGYDDVYVKLPFRCYEMHVSLIGSDMKLWWSYYKDIKDRLVRIEGTDYGYAFTDEDFYVYMILHAYKHYQSAGTGIRLFFDMYIYINEKSKNMDWDYIKKQCELLKIEPFEELVRTLTVKLMLDDKSPTESLSSSERKSLMYIIESGTYGTVSNRIKNGVGQSSDGRPPLSGKVKYLFSRIFLPKELMYIQNPLCRKHHWLLPAFYIIRIFKGLTQKRIYDEVGKTVKMK